MGLSIKVPIRLPSVHYLRGMGYPVWTRCVVELHFLEDSGTVGVVSEGIVGGFLFAETFDSEQWPWEPGVMDDVSDHVLRLLDAWWGDQGYEGTPGVVILGIEVHLSPSAAPAALGRPDLVFQWQPTLPLVSFDPKTNSGFILDDSTNLPGGETS